MTTALERSRAERALRESEKHFRNLVENSSDIIFVVDDRGTFRYETPSASRLLGYAPGYLLGKNGFLFMHPEDMVKLREGFGRVLSRSPGVTGARQELRLRCSDGSYLHFEGVAASLHATGVHAVLLNLRNISERVQAEAERRALELKLQQAQKLESLGALAGGIAHDFNNLLTGILGNSGLALSQLEAGSPVRESVQLIETAAHRAAALTRQLLAYAGKGQFVKRTVMVSKAVEEMAYLLELSVSKRCTLKLRFTPEVPPVEVDLAQLRQVIMNLIVNASESIGDEGGVIALSTSVVVVGEGERNLEAEIPAGRYVCIEVRDTGCGMTEEVKRRLFEPFFTTKFTGRGLGLAAVLGIVRGHQGAIRVESEPGQGTRVQILLPPAAEPLEAAPPAELESLVAEGAVCTVLVVDDDETVRAVAKGILESAGHRVLLAKDGQEGVELVARRGAELGIVLLDLTMPVMDGEETFRALRALRPELPVLLSSGYGEQETTERFLAGELAGFIQKPYSRVRLLDAIAKVLRAAQPKGS
jgi:PAS domain S-box-containing protein